MRSALSPLWLLVTSFTVLLTSTLTFAAEAEGPAELLVRARKAEARVDYHGALALVRTALAQGGASPELTWKLYVAEAELSGAVGLLDEATQRFARALLLNPNVELPPDPSPRLVGPFQKARAQVGQTRLSAVPASERLAHRQVRTRVRVDGDLFQLVAGARLVAKAGPTLPLALSDVYEGYWGCAQEPCEHHISLLDSRGNELLRVGSPESPLMALAPPVTVAVDDRPWFRRGWPYFIAAGAFAVGGTYFATRTVQVDSEFRTARDSPDLSSYARVRELDAERSRDYAFAASGLGLAVGSGALGVAFW